MMRIKIPVNRNTEFCGSEDEMVLSKVDSTYRLV